MKVSNGKQVAGMLNVNEDNGSMDAIVQSSNVSNNVSNALGGNRVTSTSSSQLLKVTSVGNIVRDADPDPGNNNNNSSNNNNQGGGDQPTPTPPTPPVEAVIYDKTQLIKYALEGNIIDKKWQEASFINKLASMLDWFAFVMSASNENTVDKKVDNGSATVELGVYDYINNNYLITNYSNDSALDMVHTIYKEIIDSNSSAHKAKVMLQVMVVVSEA